MLSKVVLWLVKTYFGGRQKSWLAVSVVALVLRVGKSFFSRKELVDLSKVKPGQRLVIEHLNTSHRSQIKKEKKPKSGSKRTEFSLWKSRNSDS